MATDVGLEQVRAAVAPAVRDLGLELYDVEILGGSNARTLRVTVTRDEGVDLEAITAVTQTVSPLIDEADALPGSYLLEVSSPGVERALRRPEHFRGAVGEEVSIKIRTEGASRRVHGVLRDAQEDRCRVETDDGALEEIAFNDIAQARTMFTWGPSQPAQARPGKARGKQRGEAIA